jgi:hypothetical protein
MRAGAYDCVPSSAPVTVKEHRSLNRSLALRDWDIEPFQGRRNETIEADEVDQLIGTVLAERLDGKPVERLRQGSSAAVATRTDRSKELDARPARPVL